MKVSRRKNRFAPRASRPTQTYGMRMLLEKAYMNPRFMEMIAQSVGKNNALLQRIRLKETVTSSTPAGPKVFTAPRSHSDRRAELNNRSLFNNWSKGINK